MCSAVTGGPQLVSPMTGSSIYVKSALGCVEINLEVAKALSLECTCSVAACQSSFIHAGGLNPVPGNLKCLFEGNNHLLVILFNHTCIYSCRPSIRGE